VELFADEIDDGARVRHEMRRIAMLEGVSVVYIYQAVVSAV
jgi:hypothetical protein